jgi:hypothetical protein
VCLIVRFAVSSVEKFFAVFITAAQPERQNVKRRLARYIAHARRTIKSIIKVRANLFFGLGVSAPAFYHFKFASFLYITKIIAAALSENIENPGGATGVMKKIHGDADAPLFHISAGQAA